ncbi:MAG: DUF3581 family protein [Gammaproteobacteria bacterium]|nr:DUF3581 family protein [Gammaproteobacteria bacterium]
MLSSYYQEVSGKICFSREQGSDFAKKIANDYNPLHHVDAKRFCVPGDLLFSLVLKKYGISRKMKFVFSKMVTENVKLVLSETLGEIDITDGEKSYLSVTRSGEVTQDAALIENLIKNYVAFSGTAFPHVVVPLMAEQDVMINPDRPMAMYQSMSIELDRLDLTSPEIDFSKALFEYEGKRGDIRLPFNFIEKGEIVGRGEKHMVVSGVMKYDAAAMDALIKKYNDSMRY